jgi:CRP-like cAMP-binding protein
MIDDENRRFQAKSREQQFLNMMVHEYNFASKIAQAVLADAQECLLGQPTQLKPGQMRVVLLKQDAAHGRSLRQMATREVTWTVNAGQEDREVEKKQGRVALRQARIQRLLGEAIEQGAVATQEDIAAALQVTTRTIKRDCAQMQQRGLALPTRGNLKGIGRGQTHKGQIVGRWLRGETYDQIALHTRHSLSCIQRYVQTFARVIQLHRQSFALGETSLALQISEALVQEYLAVYRQNDTPFCRQRLQQQLERLSGTGTEPKKGVR